MPLHLAENVVGSLDAGIRLVPSRILTAMIKTTSVYHLCFSKIFDWPQQEQELGLKVIISSMMGSKLLLLFNHFNLEVFDYSQLLSFDDLVAQDHPTDPKV